MNIIIRKEKNYSNKWYNCNNNVIYSISNERDCDESVKLTEKYDGSLFIEISYDNGESEYVDLQSYIKCGDKIESNNIIPHNHDENIKSLADVLVKEQKNECINKILNGADPQTLYDKLPLFFKWNGTDLIEVVNCKNVRKITQVKPKVYIAPFVEKDGELKDGELTDEIMSLILKKASASATNSANNILKTFNKKLKSDISIGKTQIVNI